MFDCLGIKMWSFKERKVVWKAVPRTLTVVKLKAILVIGETSWGSHLIKFY